MNELLNVTGVSKIFTLHTQGGAQITALNNVEINVMAGECVALYGPSGVGKSTLLRLLYGNYRAESGSISVRHKDHVVDLVNAPPREILDVRKHTIGYVSQFLRVIPRVPTIEVVAEPLFAQGYTFDDAITRAEELLGAHAASAQLMVAFAGYLFRRRTATSEPGQRIRGNVSVDVAG